MDDNQAIRPLSLNMDVSRKFLKDTEMFYALNHERYLSKNGEKTGTLGKTTPRAANYPACDMVMAAGENYSVGEYSCEQTNELYSWTYNSNGVHFIQRINNDGHCQIVYYHPCLPLSAAPEHKITQFRAYLKVEKICAGRHGKQLIWVNGTEFIGMLDTEAAIATNNFTTPFFNLCPDPCAMISMCVPDPCGCLKAEFIPLDPADTGKKNNTTDVGLKFSYRHIYYDNRASIWSDPSTVYYQDRGCFDNAEGLPRCIKLHVPVGNPMVDRIEIAYIKDNIWYKTDIVEKYKKYTSAQEKWYERQLSEEVQNNFNPADCTFGYTFCNDKQCDVIDPAETNRVFNPMPREPQGLMLVEEALGMFNYKQGNCPLDKFESDKLKINITCDENSCEQEFITLKVRAIVHNREHGGNQFIYRLGGAEGAADDVSDKAYFGGLNNNGIGTGDLESGYDQYFRDKTRNFIVYAEGTDYYAEMVQWKSHAFFVNTEKFGTVAGLTSKSTIRRWRRAINNNEFFYQEGEIKVPRGSKGFLRLSSHQSTGNDQDKSTFVIGILNELHQYKGKIDVSSISDLTIEEIYFDTCNVTGDTLEINQAFVVDDNAVDTGLAKKATSFYGYIKDKSGRPVEGAIVALSSITSTTDHNGFYHLYKFQGTDNSEALNIKVELDCFSFDTIETMNVQGENGYATSQNHQIDSDSYNINKLTNIYMKVQDCNGTGVSGIRVAISGSKYKVSGADGIARFKIRNYSTRDRVVRTIVLNGTGCIETNCLGGCSPCMPSSTGATAVCYTGGTQNTTLPAGVINTTSIVSNKNGLKSGGVYPFAYVVKGSCGRISAAYRLQELVIPKTQTKAKEGFCSFSWDGTGMVLPEWAECINILRGTNLNQFELQWLVDKIERTDDGKIKLTIQSLNDYNEKYLFKTNTVYQWTKNDRVEFIKNGDGKIFSISQYGLLNYLTLSPFHDQLISGKTDPPADYFNQLLITDDGKLDDLKEGAIIELQREKDCTTEPAYYSICVSIPVGPDRKLLYPTGTFHTFDTYFVNRKVGKFPVQKFEHHSPSDFWGTRLDDTGRAYFENKYENERRYGRNISINSPNEYNRFGDLVRSLKDILQGDITAIWLTDGQIGIAISEHNNALFQVDDNLLRVGSDGVVHAVPAEAVISDATAKLSGSYGCQYPHIGGIFFGDGYATWWDINKGHYIKHDYKLARPFDEGKCNNFFSRRGQEIETFNRAAVNELDKLRIAVGINMQTGALNVTVKALRDSGINNESAPFKKQNETISLHPVEEDFLTFSSFTPEGYGNINLFDGHGCAFVTYLNGLPYIHPLIPKKWLEYYGIAVDWIIGVSLNKSPNKIKIGLAMEEQSENMFFLEDVTTDQKNYRSEVPAIRFKKTERKWNASFLGNINSRAGLYGGDAPRGYYIAVTFKRDNTDGLKYLTTDDKKRVEYSELDAFLFKFTQSEQAGMTENL